MLTAEELLNVVPVEPPMVVGPYDMDDEGKVRRSFVAVSELVHDADCRSVAWLIDDKACLVSEVPLLVCLTCERAILLPEGRQR